MNNPVAIRQKILGIQYCRALAATFVLLYHIGTTAEAYNLNSIFTLLFDYGKYGVDFFFVISGFIIFNAHYEDIGARGKCLTYAKKRFFRIYPLYLIVLTTKVLIFLGLGIPIPEHQKSLDYFLKSYLLIPMQDQYPFLSVAWTLSYELTFYLYFLGAMLMQRNLFYALLAIWASGIVGYNLFLAEQNPFIDHLLNAYNIQFIIGILISILYRRKKTFEIGIKSSMLLLGFFAVFKWVENPLYEKGLLACFFGTIILTCDSISRTIERSNFTFIDRILRLLGDASYSIYLVHTIIITMTYKTLIPFVEVNALGFVALFAALGAGLLSWKYVENPLLKFTKARFIS